MVVLSLDIKATDGVMTSLNCNATIPTKPEIFRSSVQSDNQPCALVEIRDGDHAGARSTSLAGSNSLTPFSSLF